MKMKLLITVAFCGAILAAQGATAAPRTPAQAAPQSASAPAGTPALPPPPTVTGPSKVATINIQEAIETSIEGKHLMDDLTARFKPKDDELKATNAEIVAMNSKLSAGGNTMSQAAKDDLQRQITAKQRDLQQAAENAQSDYENAHTDVMNTVGVKMMDIIKSYAESHGYTYVMDISIAWPQSPVLYFNPGTNITGDIVKLYDAAHPTAQ